MTSEIRESRRAGQSQRAIPPFPSHPASSYSCGSPSTRWGRFLERHYIETRWSRDLIHEPRFLCRRSIQVVCCGHILLDTRQVQVWPSIQEKALSYIAQVASYSYRVDDSSERSATESIKTCRYLILKHTLLILRKFVYTPRKSKIFHRVIILLLYYSQQTAFLPPALPFSTLSLY